MASRRQGEVLRDWRPHIAIPLADSHALSDDLAALLDALETTAAIVAGISIGGMIAQSLAAARPDLVKALVLLDTGHLLGNLTLVPYHAIVTLSVTQ